MVSTGAVLLFCWALAAQQTQKPASQQSSPAIQSHVNVAIVPVVVRDSEGRAVGTLKKEDFQVFDRGREQSITGFAIEQRALENAANSFASGSKPSRPSGTAPQAPTPQRFIIFMFDDRHLGSGALIRAQKALTAMLEKSPPSADSSAVLSSSGTNSGITRDRRVLERAIMNLKSHALSSQELNECPSVDYYEADLILNRNDQAALNIATQQAMACANLDVGMAQAAQQMAISAAQRSLIAGDEDVRLTIDFVMRVVRGMARLPGESVLILISPGFPAVTPEAMSLRSELLDTAAQSNVTIDAVDARDLSAGVMNASESGGTAVGTRTKIGYAQRAAAAGEDLLGELADGTGGTFLHNSNDLERGLSRLVLAPEYVYLLEFSVADVKHDGTYHPLRVNVDQTGLSLQARRGYFAPQSEKEAK